MYALHTAIADNLVRSSVMIVELINHYFKNQACLSAIALMSMLPVLSRAQVFHKTGYKGVDVSFGPRTFKLASDVPELSGLSVLEEGGQLGIIVGNNILRAKVGIAGFFYSAGNVPRTIDMFESDLSFNFYPLELIKTNTLARPYFAGGIIYDKVKFYGHYLDQDKGAVNYSSSKEPFIGSVHQGGLAAGAGIEFTVLNNDFDFIHVFSEGKYGRSFMQQASKEILGNTSFSDQWIVSVGVRFGIRDGYTE